jgi:2-methylcitrate dehydratase PrpD
MTGLNATCTLARYAAHAQFEALPASLISLVKQCVLDTLGVIIGASTLAHEATIVADYVTAFGGTRESTVLGFGHKAPAAWAAFANGSFAHMLDYDDTGGGHVSITTVPVAFALAEKLGGVNGRDFIAAVSCGIDIQTRLALSVPIPDWTITEGWFATQLFGYLSGAATAGRILGLNPDQMANALGIGFNQMSGSRQMAVGEATHMRSMQAGFSGQGSVLAAELAQRGIIGSKDVIEGRYGLFKTYIRTNDPDWEAIVGGLGVRFPILETHGFKVWPACGYTRVTNTAALQIRNEHQVDPQSIESVTVIGGTGGTKLLCEPLELKRRPKTSIDGKYSIPFTTAVMLTKGGVGLRDYTEEGLNDPAVLSTAELVAYRDAPATAQIKGGSSAGSVGNTTLEIKMRDGRVFTCTPTSVPGDPSNPASPELLERKFRDCVSFSAKTIGRSGIDRAIELIQRLETLPDVSEVIDALS